MMLIVGESYVVGLLLKEGNTLILYSTEHELSINYWVVPKNVCMVLNSSEDEIVPLIDFF